MSSSIASLQPTVPASWLGPYWSLGSFKAWVGALAVSFLLLTFVNQTIGAIAVSVVVVAAVLKLRAEFAVAAMVFVLLLISLGRVPSWYLQWFRWILAFLASAVVCFRSAEARRWAHSARASPFKELMRIYLVVVGFSAVNAALPTLSLAKFLALVFLWIGCSAGGSWIVYHYGPLAARRWGESWLILLLPALLANVVIWMSGSASAYAQLNFRGITGNANTLGATLAFFLPFLAPWLLERRQKPADSRRLVAILALGLLYFLLITRSRASTLAFLVAAAVLFYAHPRSPLRKIVPVAGVLVFFVFMIMPGRSASSLTEWIYKGRFSRGVLGSRTDIWQDTRADFLAHPWLGAGYGITAERDPNWTLRQIQYQNRETGSSLWATLAQVGILGAVPFFVGLLSLLVRSIGFARAVGDPWFSALAASAWAGFADSFFEGWMVSPGNGLLWLMMAHCCLLDAIMSSYRPPDPFGRHAAEGSAFGHAADMRRAGKV